MILRVHGSMAALTLVLASVNAASCDANSSANKCTQNDQVSCECTRPDGKQALGTQTCQADGSLSGCTCVPLGPPIDTCQGCINQAKSSSCKATADACVSAGCSSIESCVANSCGSLNNIPCMVNCAEQNISAATPYFALLQCTFCQSCSSQCSWQYSCEGDFCVSFCEDRFPAGKPALDAQEDCLVCGACHNDCNSLVTMAGTHCTTQEKGCSSGTSCDSCLVSSCATSSCSTQIANCNNSQDCLRLSDCIRACP